MASFRFAVTRQNLTLILFFLFPLFGSSVRSWTGTFFFFIFFLGVWSAAWRSTVLEGYEKLAFVVMPAALFSLILLSCLFNGWTEEQTKGFAVFIRFLMIIPIYFLLRAEPCGVKAFALGCVFSAPILVVQGGYDISLLNLDRAYGVYGSPGLFAGQACIFGIFCFVYYRMPGSKYVRSLFFFGALFSVIAILMSGSRATFFALTLMAILSFLRGCFSKRRLLSLAAIVGMIGIFYVSIPSFNSQVDRGFQEVATYIKITDPVRHEDHGSVGTRFELWRAGLLIFRDYPVLGIGWRNFSNVTTEYVSEGLINPQVLGHRHPHNTYIEFLNNSGLLGLLLLVSWGFVLWRHVSRVGSARQEPFGSGARLYLAFLGVSAINEGGLLIYGNSLSFYLVALAAIMSSLSYRR